MNNKIKDPTLVIQFYYSLYEDLKIKSLHLYVAKSYYYAKIAEKFNLSQDRAYRILAKEWRKEEFRGANDDCEIPEQDFLK